MDQRASSAPPAASQGASALSPAEGSGSRRSQGDPGSLKETLESVLVAFVLAFIFRAFVVEAFVIPTGSMAPTLLGAHMRHTCQDCGYKYEVNHNPRQPSARRRGDADQYGFDPTWDAEAICPNCGFPAQPTPQMSYYGDRILVLKYLYLFQQPQRWDVVVFKSPARDENDKAEYVQNYIKRLVGRPGEAVLILDGDIYTAPTGTDDLSAFHIQTKPYRAQQALWRVVYDNDYRPRQLSRQGARWRQPWTVQQGQGWDVSGRVLHFDNADGASALQFDRTAIPNTQPLSDWLAYDFSRGSEYTPSPVSDLKLDLYYDRLAGDGPLRLSLTKRDTTFIAEITPTHARLFMEHADAPQARAQVGSDVPLTSKGPLHIEFANVDHQVTLRIDGRDVVQTTPYIYAPDVTALLSESRRPGHGPLPQVRIEADRQRASIAHLGLFRDVHYINRQVSPGKPPEWGVPGRPIHLGPDEYFVLGDNSLISGDARFWQDPIDLPAEDLHVQAGRVPERFLLGKAFFVYWPAGYPLGGSGPALVPNVGDMRFIH
jgi:signal peptidase I